MNVSVFSRHSPAEVQSFSYVGPCLARARIYFVLAASEVLCSAPASELPSPVGSPSRKVPKSQSSGSVPSPSARGGEEREGGEKGGCGGSQKLRGYSQLHSK